MQQQNLARTVQALSMRVEALEEEKSIMHTLHRYGYCLDYGLEKEWVDLFTHDAMYTFQRADGSPGRSYRGHKELAEFAANHTRAPYKYHKHIVAIPFITINGGEAQVETYFARLDTRESGAYISSFGRYKDRLVKQGGHWRFQERIVEGESTRPPGT
jgi:hypothetical protein